MTSGWRQVHPRHQAVGGPEVDADDGVRRCQIRSGTFVFIDQIGDVFAAVQDAADCVQRLAARGPRPTREVRLQFGVDAARMFSKRSRGGFELRAASAFLDRHVELENFFQQFGRNVFRALFADVEAFELQQVQGARDGIAQRPVGIVQDGAVFERVLRSAAGFAGEAGPDAVRG